MGTTGLNNLLTQSLQNTQKRTNGKWAPWVPSRPMATVGGARLHFGASIWLLYKLRDASVARRPASCLDAERETSPPRCSVETSPNYVKFLVPLKTQPFVPQQQWWTSPVRLIQRAWRMGQGKPHSTDNDMFSRAVKRNIQERRALYSPVEASKDVNWDQLELKWIDHLRYLDKLSGGRSSENNRVTLLVGGMILPSLLNAIEAANERVWIETYIFDGSSVSERFIQALLAAKSRGVDVALIVDWLGAFDMPSRWIRQLRDADIPVVVFNNWRNMGFRDHRKLAIIDDAGFCGSANISVDAAPEALGGNARFFDIHMKVEGPAVHHLGELFCETLLVGNQDTSRRPPTPPEIPADQNGGTFVQVLESNASRQRRIIQTAYNRVISTASLSVSATAGYFAPPALLYCSLKTVARRRIPMTLFLSGNSDVWGDVYAASFKAAKLQKVAAAAASRNSPSALHSNPSSPLQRQNTSLRVWFSQSQHCHAKTLVIDGLWAAVGSFNFDRHSGRRNMEAVVAVLDTALANKLEAIHRCMASNTEPSVKTVSTVLHPNADFLHQPSAEVMLDSNAWTLPTTIEMTLEDWTSTPAAQRLLMRLAYWLINTSASPMFDCFDDVDGCAELEKRREKWAAMHNRAQLFFSFGPSSYSLEMGSSCCY